MRVKQCKVCSKNFSLKEYYKLTWWNFNEFKCPECNSLYKSTDKTKLVYSILIVFPIVYIWINLKLTIILGLSMAVLWFVISTLILQPIILAYDLAEKHKK